MTRVLVFGSGILMLVATARSEQPTVLPKAKQTIKIDGELTDAAWQTAAVAKADYEMGQVGKPSKQPRLITRYTWDDHYLYIAYETFDQNLIAVASDKTQGPKGNRRQGCEIWHPEKKIEVVEFFISFGDTRFFWELHHNAANQFNDVWCSVYDESWPISKSTRAPFGIHFGHLDYLQDDMDTGRTLAMATRLKANKNGTPSTINDSSDNDTGYTAELRIPWHSLGPPVNRRNFVTVEASGQKKRVRGPWKMAGQQVLILAVVQDGDLPVRYHHSSPTFSGAWFHRHAKDWPAFVLKDY
ncbi:MAG: hypothetical protein IH991_18590 [Planctomycetes bacterium]|nr:hypothetical protein [Planctomycetota bacterium]